jgi:hypothetical protein
MTTDDDDNYGTDDALPDVRPGNRSNDDHDPRDERDDVRHHRRDRDDDEREV